MEKDRITIDVPTFLKHAARREANRRGLSLTMWIRLVMEAALEQGGRNDAE